MDSPRTYTLKIRGLAISVIVDGSIISSFPSSSLTVEDIARQGRHYHALYELFFVNDKPLTVLTENGPLVFSDCIVCIPPHFMHNTVRNDDLRVLFSFSDPKEQRSELSEFVYSFFGRNSPFSFEADKSRKEYIKEIFKRKDLPCTISHEIISAFFKLIFCDIYEHNISVKSLPPETKVDNYFTTIDKTITDYQKDVNLKTLAEKLNLSTKQTSRIVRRYYKATLSELICKKRLGVASELLANSDIPVSDIIEHINFPSESYFFARFKKEYGLTPLKYREATRKSQ